MNRQNSSIENPNSTMQYEPSSERPMIEWEAFVRMLLLVTGVAFTVFGAVLGVTRRNIMGIGMLLLGGELVYRGTTGKSPTARLLGREKARTNEENVSVPHEQGKHVTAIVVVDKPVGQMYSYWRNFSNLPRIMSHLESVEVLDTKRSRWTAKGPAGTRITWDAEIINEIENEVIGWRSLDNAQVANAGSVRFNPMPDGKTEIKVEMEYMPPAGKAGAAVSKLLGADPEQQIKDDLQRFKEVVEGTATSTRAKRQPAPVSPENKLNGTEPDDNITSI